MGGSYGNILAIGATGDGIVEALGNDPAYLASFDGAVAVFSEAAVMDTMSRAIEISALVAGDIIGFSVFDDDVLGCVLCRAGEVIAEVTVPSLEDYAGISADELELMAEAFGEAAPGAGNVDDPVGFVNGVGRGDARQALGVLGDDYGGDRVVATERHRDLLAALALPTAIAGWDYYQFEAGIDGFEGDAQLVSG